SPARAAKLRWIVDAEEAELAAPVEQLPREDLCPLPFVGVRRDLLGDEVAQALAEDLVLLGEEGHQHGRYRSPASSASQAASPGGIGASLPPSAATEPT